VAVLRVVMVAGRAWLVCCMGAGGGWMEGSGSSRTLRRPSVHKGTWLGSRQGGQPLHHGIGHYIIIT
jgi:hypothetical protein